MTRVKNQGSVTSCTVFSAIAALEGQYAKKTGKLVSLSEQYIIDCAQGYGVDVCRDGGWIETCKNKTLLIQR